MGNICGSDTSQNVDAEVEQFGRTALINAIRCSNNQLALELIGSGEDVNVTDANGDTPLMHAIKNENKDIVIALIQAECDVNACTRNGTTALILAVQQNNYDIAELLINSGADVNVSARSDGGSALLMLAVEKGNISMVNALLKAGANVNASDIFGNTALFKAKKNISELLIKRGASINVPNIDGHTPLFKAANSGDEETVSLLVDKGADVNIVDNNKRTALHFAAQTKKLEESTNIDPLDDACRSSYFASSSARQSITTKIVKVCDDINAKDDKGRTALCYAVHEELKESVKVLIDAGADVNIKDNEGKTPLFYTSNNSNPDMATLLINAGAIIDARDINQETALFNAVRTSNLKVIKVLINNGKATTNARDQYGRTPIFYAFSGNHQKHMETLRVLLENGAQINDTDSCGLSVLSYFIERFTVHNDITYGTLFINDKLIPMLNVFKKYKLKHSMIFLAIINVFYLKAISTDYCTISRGVRTQSLLFTTKLAMKYASRKLKKKLRGQLQSLDKIKQDHLPEILNLLIQQGDDLMSVDSKGNTALHYAAALPVLGSSERLSMEIISKLEKHGARFDSRNHDNQTPLMYGLTTWANYNTKFHEFKAMRAVCDHMVKSGGSFYNEISRNGESVFHILMKLFRKALADADREIVGDVLQDLTFILKLFSPPDIIQGVTVNKRDNMQRSPLHLWASLSLQQDENYKNLLSEKRTFESLLKDIFNHLRACGIQLNARDAEDQTPLHYCRTWSAVKCLVETGAKLNDLDNKGRPPLLTAAHNKVFKVKEGCFFADVENEPKSFFKQCIDKDLDLWSHDKEGESILSLILSPDCFALANGLVEAVCELKPLILNDILLILCKDQATNTLWKSTLVRKILRCPNRPHDLNSALRICCDTIKGLHVHGDVQLTKEETITEDTKNSQPVSVHLDIIRQLLSCGADGKSCKDLYYNIPRLHKTLTEEVDLNQAPLSIPWTSCSHKHKAKLERVARKQNVASINTYWYHKEHIGSGSFGHVFAGINEKDGREFAIKKIEKLRMARPEDRREITILGGLSDCEQVVNYLYFDDKTHQDFVYIVLELMEGDLDEYFESPFYEALDNIQLCRDLVMGLKYLHNNKPAPILHRDLKPGNILYKVHPKLCLKIADFGLSSPMSATGTTVLGSHAGTRSWIAPDVISSNSYQHTKESDMYSCGLLLHYILSPKRHPFSPVDCSNQTTEMIELKTRNNMVNNTMEGWDDKISAEAIHLIKRLLSSKPEERSSAVDSLSHPLFWKKKKKLDFLYAVGNQPEIEKFAVSGPHLKVQSDIEALFSTIVKYPTWNETVYTHMPSIYADMKKPKRYYTRSINHLLRFIRNAISHVSEANKTIQIQKHILEDAVFLKYFPNLVMEVYKIVIVQYGWDKRDEIKHVLPNEDL